MPPKSSEIPALFKAEADTATVSFDAAKAGKLSRGFQDCEQIGSFEKSGLRVRHLCARSGGGCPRFHRGWGVGIYDPLRRIDVRLAAPRVHRLGPAGA